MKNVKVLGLEALLRKLDKEVGADVIADVDRITEAYTRKMAEESAAMAPIDSGALKGSIASSPEQVEEHVWQYGSNLPYALRQEYEHKTHKAFIRKSVWNNRQKYRQAVLKRLTKG